MSFSDFFIVTVSIYLIFYIPGFLIAKYIYLSSNIINIHLVGLLMGFVVIILVLNLVSYLMRIDLFIYLIVLINVITLYLNFDIFKNHLYEIISKQKINLIVLIIIFLSLSFVVQGLYVQPLHDSLGLAVTSKAFANCNGYYINYPESLRFYPFFCTYIIYVISEINNLEVTHVIQVLNMFFIVYSILSLSLIFRTLLRSKRSLYFFIFINSFVVSFIIQIYCNSGKNAQVVSYFFQFTSVLFCLNFKDLKSINYLNLIIPAIFVSFFIHFSNFLLIIYTVPFVLWLLMKKNEFNRKNFFYVFLIFLVIGGGNLYYIMVSKSGMSLVSENNIKGDIFYNFYRNLFSIWRVFLELFPRFTFFNHVSYKFIYIFFFLFGVLLFLYKKSYYKKYIIYCFSCLLILYSIGLPRLSNILPFQFFIIISFFMSYFFDFVFKFLKVNSNQFYRTISFFLLTFGLFYIFVQYSENRKYSSVHKDDLIVFKWIHSNISRSAYILPVNVLTRGVSQPYNLDSSLYLEYYTNNNSLINFFTIDNTQNKRIKNNDLYNHFLFNPFEKSSLVFLKENNIEYLFFGSQNTFGSSQLKSSDLDQRSNSFSKVFQSGNCKVYKIL
jgi:hypothetical protein